MGIFSPDAHHVCATISIRPNCDRVLLRAELMSAYHFRPNVDVSCLMGPALEAHHYTAKPRQEVALLGYIN